MTANSVKPTIGRTEAIMYMQSEGFTVNHLSASARIDQLAASVHISNIAGGFWSDLEHYKKTGEVIPVERNFGEMIALIHSELSEALEGYRTNAPSDKLSGFTAVEEELADVLIRLLDLTGAMDCRIGAAFYAKFEYNRSREDHRLENRATARGKKF